MENALVHNIGDVDTLTEHITMLHQDRALLHKLRRQALAGASSLTWAAAGAKLRDVYSDIVARRN
jgi:hypothetical protein